MPRRFSNRDISSPVYNEGGGVILLSISFFTSAGVLECDNWRKIYSVSIQDDDE